jgi:hypothetical protein
MIKYLKCSSASGQYFDKSRKHLIKRGEITPVEMNTASDDLQARLRAGGLVEVSKDTYELFLKEQAKKRPPASTELPKSENVEKSAEKTPEKAPLPPITVKQEEKVESVENPASSEAPTAPKDSSTDPLPPPAGKKEKQKA